MDISFLPCKKGSYHKIISKPASDKDLNNISQCIGTNWEMMAPFLLGTNTTVTVEQIKEDHKGSHKCVYYLLYNWRAQTNDPSLAHLFHSMYQAGMSMTIDWNAIADKLKVTIKDIQACKAGYPGQEQEQEQETGQQQASGDVACRGSMEI
ncbi:uncharacterized protein LOC132760662 [Ruditapes philippinarum]|uniref:uncharacterized protein LOC132760662 n=1 Tax=Ruditapes philippinarum TaxID=129788 RepID=UPI00295B1622|nr:uncharacterized protein LOC132760662 [Ruditapes philippinarum]